MSMSRRTINLLDPSVDLASVVEISPDSNNRPSFNTAYRQTFSVKPTLNFSYTGDHEADANEILEMCKDEERLMIEDAHNRIERMLHSTVSISTHIDAHTHT